jgi:Domain of unknown function (DUF4158)
MAARRTAQEPGFVCDGSPPVLRSRGAAGTWGERVRGRGGSAPFTDAERERLSRFRRDVSPADLLAFFTLSDDELVLIGDRRGDHNRLGFGLQLKTLPYLGFVPDDLGRAPVRIVA